MSRFEEDLIDLVDEAEEGGIDFSTEGVEAHFTLDEKPGIIFSLIIQSEDSYYETYDDRVLN